MPGQWLFYPSFGDPPVWTLYDHSLAEDVAEHTCATHVELSVAVLEPDARGQPKGQESEQLAALEQSWIRALENVGGRFVGRVTLDGTRALHAYADVPEEMLAAEVERMRAETDRDIRVRVQPDPERSAYSALKADPSDWRVIRDMGQVAALKSKGDATHVARPIRHWSFFPEQDGAAAFARWAEGEGYAVEDCRAPEQDGDPFVVRLRHYGPARVSELSPRTVVLHLQSLALGGEYDGWECESTAG